MSEQSIGDAFPIEQARVRELLDEYQKLPGGVGLFGAAMLKQVLARADRAAISGDVVAILLAYNELKGCS